MNKNVPRRDWRLWWYARLETALEREDLTAAREALRNLARLGVEVHFTLPPVPAETVEEAKEINNAS
jgi:hypothetical protein